MEETPSAAETRGHQPADGSTDDQGLRSRGHAVEPPGNYTLTTDLAPTSVRINSIWPKCIIP